MLMRECPHVDTVCKVVLCIYKVQCSANGIKAFGWVVGIYNLTDRGVSDRVKGQQKRNEAGRQTDTWKIEVNLSICREKVEVFFI